MLMGSPMLSKLFSLPSSKHAGSPHRLNRGRRPSARTRMYDAPCLAPLSSVMVEVHARTAMDTSSHRHRTPPCRPGTILEHRKQDKKCPILSHRATFFRGYAAMSISIACKNLAQFLSIGNKKCPISFQCILSHPATVFQGCQVDAANRSSSLKVSCHDPVSSERYRCDRPVTLSKRRHNRNRWPRQLLPMWAGVVEQRHSLCRARMRGTPNVTSVWIDAPIITKGDSGQYSSTISPSLSGTDYPCCREVQPLSAPAPPLI